MNRQGRERVVQDVAQEVMDRIEMRECINRLADQALAELEAREGKPGPGLGVSSRGSRPLQKLILVHGRSPGDILMLTAAVRDLALSYPNRFQVDVRTPYPALWENNPHLTSLSWDDPEVEIVDCDYPLILDSNRLPYHFIHSFRLFLEERLGLPIHPHAFKGDIHLRHEEKERPSQVDEITGEHGTPFWIITSGGKTDFTAKWWHPARYQEVVNHFRDRLQFVQIGAAAGNHVHPPLDGVINLVGKTDMRQIVRLMYHADGVVCPVTMLMHLASAVETRPGRPMSRPCVVIAGGREPAQWEAYPHHQYLHTIGMLSCCDGGGCWKSRVVALNDGDSHDTRLCERPILTDPELVLPACLDMIKAQHVIGAIEQYLHYA